MGNLTDEEICINLKRLYDESESRIKTNAIVSRAYIDKISTEAINDKVNAQMNSIKAGIYNINPKFKEGSKNYDVTKTLVAETLASYEQALLELSQFYDGKLEQLILRKVELEASLVGSILTEEYLREKLIRNNNQKENDKVKVSVKDNIKQAINKIKGSKDNNFAVNPMDISKLLDQQDVVCELEQKLSSKVEKTEGEQKENIEEMEKIENEISLIVSEIDKLNERKKASIYDAMEVGDKTITTNIKKPRVIKKITRFFVSRFNTSKIVESSIIAPLKMRIENFRVNELTSINS